MDKDWSRLKRDKHPMPDFVLEALERSKLYDKYTERPPYQQNYYIVWITRAKLAATRRKRLEQMLDELERGDVYMKMKHNHQKSAS